MTRRLSSRTSRQAVQRWAERGLRTPAKRSTRLRSTQRRSRLPSRSYLPTVHGHTGDRAAAGDFGGGPVHLNETGPRSSCLTQAYLSRHCILQAQTLLHSLLLLRQDRPPLRQAPTMSAPTRRSLARVLSRHEALRTAVLPRAAFSARTLSASASRSQLRPTRQNFKEAAPAASSSTGAAP